MAPIPQKRKRASTEQKRRRKAEFAAELARRDREMKAKQTARDIRWNNWTVEKHSSEAGSECDGPYRTTARELRHEYKINRLQAVIEAGVTKDEFTKRQKLVRCVQSHPGKYCWNCNPRAREVHVWHGPDVCCCDEEAEEISDAWSKGEDSSSYSDSWGDAELAIAETKLLKQKVAIVVYASTRILKRQQEKKAKRVGTLTGTWDLYNVEECLKLGYWSQDEWYRIRITENQLSHSKEGLDADHAIHPSEMEANDCNIQGDSEKVDGSDGTNKGDEPYSPSYYDTDDENDISIHWRIKCSKGTILPFRFPKRRSLDAIPVTIKIGQDTTKTSTQAEIIFLGRDCLRFRIPRSIVDPEQFKDSVGPDTMVEFAGIRGDLLD
ncbi:hypothetical protein E6O75_ATG00242 [Venturia nashicola]|uniref:Uncharacterized protein n=1 Tax=Venturia nashicola TaxID=86259 RepID=A0A4Z1PD90_9PEZI|nr:hypothetical protein E6O75_ATG00242 [Venturia nashicola]